MSEVNQEKKGTQSELVLFFRDFIIIILIVIFIRSFIALPFQISGQSMYDSYYDKEFIIVDRISYLVFTKPKRGDVIVFKTHIKGKEYFIKRVIGLPGETIKIAEGKVYVKRVGESDFVYLDELYLSETNYNATYVRGKEGEFIYDIPEGKYFVMGDNRNASTDSRSCFSSCEYGERDNFIGDADIVGRIWMDLGYFNFQKFAFINPNLGIDTHPRWFGSQGTFDYK